jgi:hypothetical protein
MRAVALIVALALGILGAPVATDRQPAMKVPVRIGSIGNQDSKASSVEAFRQGLRDLGWIEGQNILMEYRSEGNVHRFPVLAVELVRLKVDIVVASGAPALRALQQATSTIPIVCVEAILVEGQAPRPGDDRLQLAGRLVPQPGEDGGEGAVRGELHRSDVAGPEVEQIRRRVGPHGSPRMYGCSSGA